MSRYAHLAAQLARERIPILPLDRHLLARAAARMGAHGFTFRSRIYIARDLEGTDEGWLLLRHEAVHARDQRRFGLLFYALYVLFPLPALLSGRALWEWRAYRETLRAVRDLDGRVTPAIARAVVSAFSSSLYLWMLPAPPLWRRLVDRERSRQLVDGSGASSERRDPVE